MKAKFDMNLWQRIKAACLMWYAIVVTGEISLIDDEDAEHIQDNPDIDIGTGTNCYPFEKIWKDEDENLYTFTDGEPIL